MRGCIRVGLALEREMQLGRHLPLELGGVAGGVGSFLSVVFSQLVSVSFSGERERQRQG